MPNRIFCFSGTGNSLYIAKRIQEHIGDTVLTQITSKRVNAHVSIETDILGFVFPVYAWGPPGLVESFFTTMKVTRVEYTVVVALHAGLPGNALIRTEKLLKAQGVSLDSAFDLTTLSNYVLGVDPVSAEKAREIFTRAEPHLKHILDSIAARHKNTIAGSNLSGILKTMLIHPAFLWRGRKKLAQKFFATEKCTGCGICQKICPVENITLNADKKPEWRDQCELCLACINLCPAQAIQNGEKTANRRRYHHPGIKVSELVNRN